MYRYDTVPRGMALLIPIILLLGVSVSSALMVSLALNDRLQSQNNSVEIETARQMAQNQIDSLKLRLSSTTDWQQNLTADEISMIESINSFQMQQAQLTLATLSSTGTGASGRLQAAVTQAVLHLPILLNRPPAALILTTEPAASAGFELAAETARLALWSSQPVSFATGNRFTCSTESLRLTLCQSQARSGPLLVSGDVITSDVHAPDDVIDYLFGVPHNEMDLLRPLAHRFYENDCPTEQDGGFIWVTGNCSLPADTQLGSEQEPVLILIKNGSLEMQQGAVIFGLVVSLRHDSGFSYGLSMSVNAKIKGALLVNHSMSEDSAITIEYAPDLLANLQNHPDLQRLLPLPGSWRDFL
ncbi:hypothetical protein DXV75_02420 [Alteromonas aestuariivivens]|uniref:Type 4 fimbrial biogenesis protein PilX N-terminal domain-containing protein n=1 Tax=Alteromonas aestuariivivens TaxID=1938339 RepID=A0A3D8MFN8_9ALTE|nr:hypothetical protein [Alteromonas aestuariivivens]RDV29324.1 hypothetical protein DXV75_02420 [Alteromonas aestuariivivens]